MDWWPANLAVLAQRQPEIAELLRRTPPHAQARLEPTRSGQPGLSLDKLRLTSGVDPVSEGRSLAAQAPEGPLAVLGFGLGYHLEPLLGRDLLVWEPDPALLRLALGARDLRGLLAGLSLAVGPEPPAGLAGRAPWAHRPSARLYPAQAQALSRPAPPEPGQRPRPEQPRVLVVPALIGGSLPVAYWCGEALAALGCQVLTLPLDQVGPLYKRLARWPGESQRLDRVRAPLMRFLGELTVLEAQISQPDLVLALAQAPLDRRALADLRSLKVPTAFWFVEDHRQMVYFSEVAASYDFFFHIQGPELARQLEGLGANQAFLPMAAHPPCHRPLELSAEERRLYGAPVGFMGAGYPNRRRSFARLVGRGLPLRLWGVDWRGSPELAPHLAQERYLDSQEVVKIYNACQVVLNLHSSGQAETAPGQMDFVNPRTLEVPACGGFQLVDRVRGLDKLLVPGQEVAVFDSEDDLLDKVDHYLRHPGERDRLAQAGRRRVLAEHTYYHRMEELLTRCLGRRRQAPLTLEPEARQALAQGLGIGPQAAASLLAQRAAAPAV